MVNNKIVIEIKTVEQFKEANTGEALTYLKLVNYNSISEIRIFPNGMNARIYCKEIYMEDGCIGIIAAKFLKKKNASR